MLLETRHLTQLLSAEQVALAVPFLVEVICLPFGPCLAFLQFRTRAGLHVHSSVHLTPSAPVPAAGWQLEQKRREVCRRVSRVCTKG